jgi:hypothetical protein
MDLKITSKVSSAHFVFHVFPPETGDYNTSLRTFMEMVYYTEISNLTPTYTTFPSEKSP